MTAAEVIDLLTKRISIEGNPLGIVVHRATRTGTGTEVVLRLNTRDRETGDPTLVFHAEVLHEPFHGERGMDAMAIARHLRRMIAGLLDHEVTEWLKLDGVRIFDPHRKEGP